MDKYLEFKNKYPNFYYHGFNIEEKDNEIFVTYDFEIENLMRFNPTLRVPKDKNISYDKKLLEKIVFSAGLAEIPSYWKPTCSNNIIIECGYLDDKQISWLKKLIFNGLGEFFYINNINATINLPPWFYLFNSSNINLFNICGFPFPFISFIHCPTKNPSALSFPAL